MGFAKKTKQEEALPLASPKQISDVQENNGRSEGAFNAEVHRETVAAVHAFSGTAQSVNNEIMPQSTTHRGVIPTVDDERSVFISGALIAMVAFKGIVTSLSTRDEVTIMNWIRSSFLEGYRIITPIEMPTLSFTIEGIKINVSKPVRIHCGSYPVFEANLGQILNGLPNNLVNKVSYMFTCNNKTVPFWKTIVGSVEKDVYYVSHDISDLTNGQFKSVSVHALCSFLTTSTACDHSNGEYGIYRVEVACLPLPSRYNCVSFGTKNQNDFSGNNTQCVVMSMVANALSAANGGTEFTTQEIDTILYRGNEIYVNMFPDGNTRMIEPEEVPTSFYIAGFKFSVTTPEWVYSQVYPEVGNDPEAIFELTKALYTYVFNHFYTNATGLFLTGQGYTISFWKDRITTSDCFEPVYYLFNSHAINNEALHDVVESRNKARLFKAHNLASLAALLIKNRASMASQDQFAIHKMMIVFERSIPNVERTTDLAITTTSTTAEGEWTLAVTKKRGRPKKVKRGPTATSNVKKLVPNFDSAVTITSTTIEGEKTSVTRKRSYPKKVKQSLKQKQNARLGFQANSFVELEIDGETSNAEQVVSDSESSVITTSTAADEVEMLVNRKSGRQNKGKRGRPTPNENARLKAIEMEIERDILNADQVASDSDSAITTSSMVVKEEKTTKRGRPQKKKRGPPKRNENAPSEASKRYVISHPVVHKAALQRYRDNHHEQIIESNKRYRDNHHEQIIESKKSYRDNHHEQIIESNKCYRDNHHEQIIESNKCYRDNHHEQIIESNKCYRDNHHEQIIDAKQRYRDSHREQIIEASQRHRENNRQQIIETNRRYNTEDLNIPPLLRRRGLICEKSGEELDTVELFTLKKTSLQASATCSHPNCRAPLFEEELTRKQWCCGEGRYNILHLPPIEEQFYSDPQFVRNSRAYNNLYSFSALGSSGGWHHPPNGITFIKVQGRIYHRVFDLSYTETQNNIGLYIHDGAERQRLAHERGLSREISIEISNYLHNVNPFIECFKRLSREPSEQARLVFEHTSRRTHGNVLGDMPNGTEIAAIIHTENERYSPKSIAIWKIGNARPHTVDIFHPLYEPLQFPLLYPHGGSGWTINTKDNNNNKLSQVKYYRQLLLSEPRFSQLGRLSDEWLVDMYCRVEEERLRFIYNKQKQYSNNQLRSAPLEEVQMNLELAQDETIQAEGGVRPGRVYLPNTFTQSPRYMQCKYMDSLAIVNRLGKPSYFLTVTCNPKWVEIQNSTTSCQQSASITARVFKLKLMELLKDIRNPTWFGGIVYILYVIEFQKRGLPHAHICFRVKDGGPVQNTEIDKVIRADIPSEAEAAGRLREYVLKHMIHGPCGRGHRTDLPCWDQSKGQCNKYFPKAVIDTTHIDEKGFVHLKRNAENTGTIMFRNRSVTVNDTWVVPYNASLLLKYNCHINLEVASTRKVVKYLFKYLAKGPDEANVALVPDEIRNDEVEQYVTRRYVGACDAAWRMLEFNVTSREPNVKMLAVHLENRQTVFFRPGDEAQAAERASSDLIKYFNRPIAPEFDTLTYQDFYENYLIHTKRPQNTNAQRNIYETCDGKYFVTKRQRGEMVTRLFWVPPNRGEQFYLRLLLNVYPCRGFDDLRALGGTECRTFQAAAQAVGLADDQLEYEACLQEAATFYTAWRLRYFFVLLITNEAPGAILWERFKNALSEDYLERHQAEEEIAYRRALLDIDRLLRRHGSSLADHGLPVVEDVSTELGREIDEYILPETNARLREYTNLWLPQLSPEQRRVFEYVNSFLVNDGNNESSTVVADTAEVTCPTAIFLDGPSGTGKTLLLNVIVAHVRGVLRRVAICTASSGIAAQNYENGCTAHSMFRLPLDLVDDNGYWNLTNGSQRAELIRAASLIIYDEAPMAHKYLISLLDRSLRDLMGCNRLFGGKLIIFAGDFRQISPVIPRARGVNAVVSASLRTSSIWPKLVKFTLSQAQRTRGDQDYSDFLLRLGSGQCEVHALDPNHRTMVSLQNLVTVVTELDELIDFVFPSDALNDPDLCASRAILCTLNVNVKQINGRVLERVQGEYIRCLSADSVDPELANEFFLGSETLHRVQASGVPDHELLIKIGCVCMIMRNLSFADRLVNGTKVIVVNVSPRLITVRKPGGSDVFLIPRITFKTPIEPRSPIEIIRRQFPLQVCYSFSIHKSQGQTIERVGVDLRSDVFSHGQLYVALGRVRDQQNIRVLLQRERIINNIPFVNNVVIDALINS